MGCNEVGFKFRVECLGFSDKAVVGNKRISRDYEDYTFSHTLLGTSQFLVVAAYAVPAILPLLKIVRYSSDAIAKGSGGASWVEEGFGV